MPWYIKAEDLCTYHRPSSGGGGGGGPRADTTLYGDLMGDLNDYFTLEVGEMREVWFPKALHHGENRGLCKLRVSVTLSLMFLICCLPENS